MARPIKWTAEKVKEEVDVLRDYVKNTPFPTLYKFSAERGYGYQYWSEWLEYPRYSDTLKTEIRNAVNLCKTKTTSVLIEGGLSGKFEKIMALFCLKNIAHWRDDPTQQININTKAEAQANAASVDPEQARQRLGENVELFERYRHLPELSLKKE